MTICAVFIAYLRWVEFFERDDIWEVVSVETEGEEIETNAVDPVTEEMVPLPPVYEYKAICVDGDRKLTIRMGFHIEGRAPLSPGDKFRFVEAKDVGESEQVITFPNGVKIAKSLAE